MFSGFIKRLVKGSPLTNAELDGNFTLIQDVFPDATGAAGKIVVVNSTEDEFIYQDRGLAIEVTENEFISHVANGTLALLQWYLIPAYKSKAILQYTDITGDGTGGGEQYTEGVKTESMLIQSIEGEFFIPKFYSLAYPEDDIEVKIEEVDGSEKIVITRRTDTLQRISLNFDWRQLRQRWWEDVDGDFSIARKIDAPDPDIYIDLLSVHPLTSTIEIKKRGTPVPNPAIPYETSKLRLNNGATTNIVYSCISGSPIITYAIGSNDKVNFVPEWITDQWSVTDLGGNFAGASIISFTDDTITLNVNASNTASNERMILSPTSGSNDNNITFVSATDIYIKGFATHLIADDYLDNVIKGNTDYIKFSGFRGVRANSARRSQGVNFDLVESEAIIDISCVNISNVVFDEAIRNCNFLHSFGNLTDPAINITVTADMQNANIGSTILVDASSEIREMKIETISGESVLCLGNQIN